MTPTAQAATDHESDSQRRPGGQIGNTNSQKHGLRGLRDAMRFGLTLFPLVKGCKRIETNANRFRNAVEDAVKLARGEVTAVEGATINRAVRWEVYARLAARWLAREGD